MSSASKTSGAAQPAYPEGYLPLSDLASRNAKFGKFRLAVFHPWEDDYEYDWEGSTKKACCFKTLLVDVEQMSMYCHAEFKKTKKNEKLYEAAVKKHTGGAIFTFEKIDSLTPSRHSTLLHQGVKSSI